MIKIGDILWTNLSRPGGRVRVLSIGRDGWCQVEHVEDHSYGYKTGDKGWYKTTELVENKPLERMVVSVELHHVVGPDGQIFRGVAGAIVKLDDSRIYIFIADVVGNKAVVPTAAITGNDTLIDLEEWWQDSLSPV